MDSLIRTETDQIAAIRILLVESPIKMARQQGVGHIKGTVKRVLLQLTSRDGITGWGGGSVGGLYWHTRSCFCSP
ncbi:hypothetical protein ACFSYD_24480 [Paracoccus aerius]